MSCRLSIHFALLACLVRAACLPAAEREASPTLTSAEQDFIALAEEFSSKLNEFWEQASKLTSRREAEEFYDQHDPAIEFLPKLLAFEREHADQDVGLDALSEVISYSGRGGDQDSPGFKARREVLARLPDYADRELASMIVVRLSYGPYDPQVIDALRRLGKSADAHPAVRAMAQLELCKILLSLRAAREASTERIQAVEDGMPTRDPDELTMYLEYLASLPPADELAAGADEAIPLLEALAASGDTLRQSVYRSIDPTNHLVRIDAEKSKSSTPLSTKAAALLFKQRHLRIGQTAPNLELQLIDGQPWSLAAQHGRVVVIQFSFTGCGPCEAMYPDLRKMADEFGDRLALLTIVRDETPDNALAAVKSGKFTWRVACDGMPGEVSTRWAVDGFPEIYVVDRAGRVAAIGPRSEQLRWRVAKLIADDD